MKPVFLLSVATCLLAPLTASPASKTIGPGKKVKSLEPSYRSESPLPEGWPEPGPYNEVTRKSYPAYRAALTKGSSPNGGFWKLFKHIKRKGIPMTAPVEMKLADNADMKMEKMAFLYQNPDVGDTGDDGASVEVRDLPAIVVLSYTWQGGRDKKSVKIARKHIDSELMRLKLSATSYRIFGYNSPMVPDSRKTHELQAVLKP